MSKLARKQHCLGAVLVEFAILSIALIILTFGVVEVGRAFVQQNTLTKSVESSARYLARGYQALNPDCSKTAAWSAIENRAKNILIYGGANKTSGDAVVPNLTTSDVAVTVKSVVLSSQPVSACAIEVAAVVEYDGLFDVLIPLADISSVALNAASEERYIGE